MSTITGKINLQSLKHVKMTAKGKTGPVEGIFIPTAANKLFQGEKGLYLDLIAFDLKQAKDDQTHLIKQSVKKEERSEDDPIIGSLNTNFGGGGTVNNDAAPGVTIDSEDADAEIPF